ncbi:hypothetical protein EYF80_025138 [Liparis tanakae]|uniref:Uncharacterized protein n=1 Tax=Liparis tanakae TaxID=230148 RepID=A0A4Z2HFK4_9TELE|nr:hypothetical protein EYF80_025138 [Liparis tanakae]
MTFLTSNLLPSLKRLRAECAMGITRFTDASRRPGSHSVGMRHLKSPLVAAGTEETSGARPSRGRRPENILSASESALGGRAPSERRV